MNIKLRGYSSQSQSQEYLTSGHCNVVQPISIVHSRVERAFSRFLVTLKRKSQRIKNQSPCRVVDQQSSLSSSRVESSRVESIELCRVGRIRRRRRRRRRTRARPRRRKRKATEKKSDCGCLVGQRRRPTVADNSVCFDWCRPFISCRISQAQARAV